MSHSEKFISQDGILQCSIGSQQKKVSCHQLWTKVNASLIFQPRENIPVLVCYFRTNLGTYSLAFKGYKVWNDIPKHIKKLSSIKLFLKKYRDLLVEKTPD